MPMEEVSIKIPRLQTSTAMCREGDGCQIHRDKSSCSWNPSGPRPVLLFLWLFTCILYQTLSNKPGSIVTVPLNFLSHPTLGEEVMETLTFALSLSEVWVYQDPMTAIGVPSGGNLVELSPQTCGVCG